MSIEIEGYEDVIEGLDSITNEAAIRKALEKACFLVETTAKENAPKGTGELRRSITSKVEGTTGTVFTPLEYAPYVEFGTGLFAENGGRTDVPWCYQDDEGKWHSTSGMKPQPFMLPALMGNRKRIVELLEEAVKPE